MTVYPFAFDDDQTLTRIDDNITELGGQAINQLRDAVFSIEAVLGLSPDGSAGSVANRLDRSLDANGDIKASALTSVGLATLPITDAQVAASAGIKESKLTLDHGTSDLYTLILANKALLDSVAAFAAITGSDLSTHIGGGANLANGSPGRHVASHIDINDVPSDSRDVTFIWSGIKDKDGVLRTATNVAGSLQQINDALTTHENLSVDAHPASAITVDTTDFTELPIAADTVQKALDAIDDSDRLQIGIHRATMHANGVPRAARTEQLTLDGYSDSVVPATPITAYLINPPATSPVDSNSQGDDVIKFNPVDNSNFKFDEQFAQVKVGDIVTINYGNGLAARFPVESIRFTPGSEWFVRINCVNLFNTDGYTAYARIDRPAFNLNTRGVLAVAAANNNIDSSLLGSVIVGHPRGANALGLGFDPNQLDSAHYKLWLHLYPTGNPADKIIQLPAIDVTGNAGITPGQYTLSRVVASTNDALRAAGFNYRFIAFAHEGNFGIMLADPIGGASFSIVSGVISGSALSVSTYTQNVVGDAADGKDALGFGAAKAALASPTYSSSFAAAETAASLPTLVLTPLRGKNYFVNGVRKDDFEATFLANADGYWPAVISARLPVGVSTIEVSYTVEMNLCEAGLKPGKTIVVQPEVSFSDPDYLNADYGRFVIKSVSFTAACDTTPATTVITVINGLHGVGLPVGTTSEAGLPVHLHFGPDSVGFNAVNLIDPAPTGTTYNRFHEIYVSEEGRTFSHERARMPKQAASPTLLGTQTNWTIRDVSPKLRGFRDDSSTDLNKYIRFYVLNYNDTTGEYDGYIGKRNPSNINVSKTGDIVRARKNVPTRFYDESNIDFIEVEFFDSNPSTGTPIMPAPITTPRYVDIEVFQTLREDEEFFYLASVEVDDKRIDVVTDRREFGNVSEKNLTLSAIQFIESGDRYLHENGVIRGFNFEGVDPSNENRLLFDGGLALVNGHVSAVNAGAVAIPQVIPDGTAVPQSLVWAICVNDKNEFATIPITTTKEQFFVQPPSGANYYIPSVTFLELIETRKDLTPIYIASVTVSSFTVTLMQDARRFVANEGSNIPFTWVPAAITGDGQVKQSGQFNSFDAVQTWINFYGSANNTIKVKGTHTISSSIDMSALTQPVTLEGENAVFNITAAKGIILGSNVTIRGITFNYNPTGIAYTAGDVVNVGNACMFTSAGLSNIVIENCAFDTEADGYVAPFINFHSTTALVWTNIAIRGNKFTTAASLNISQAAIAFSNANIASAVPILANNVKIVDNSCQSNHGIYITSRTTGAGIAATNCIISRNNCGTIGYVVSGVTSTVDYVLFGLTISENACQFIASIDPEGDYVSGVFSYGTGSVKVIHNQCHWIHTVCVGISANTWNGQILIDGNSLTAGDQTFISTNHGTIFGNYAIVATGPADSNFGFAIISKNTIDPGKVSSTAYAYDQGGIVAFFVGAIISENIVNGAYGASCNVVYAISPYKINITNNILNRQNNTIQSYVNGASSTGAGFVVDNILDSHTVDGSSTSVISVPTTWIAERNKNQTVTISLRGFNGTWAFGDIGNEAFGLNSASGNVALFALNSDTADTFNIVYVSGPTFYTWEIPLNGFLPHGVTVTGASIIVRSTVTAGTLGTTTLSLSSISGGLNTDDAVFTGGYVPNTEVPLSVTGSHYVSGTQNNRLTVFTVFQHSAGATIIGDALFLTYRW